MDDLLLNVDQCVIIVQYIWWGIINKQHQEPTLSILSEPVPEQLPRIHKLAC